MSVYCFLTVFKSSVLVYAVQYNRILPTQKEIYYVVYIFYNWGQWRIYATGVIDRRLTLIRSTNAAPSLVGRPTIGRLPNCLTLREVEGRMV